MHQKEGPEASRGEEGRLFQEESGWGHATFGKRKVLRRGPRMELTPWSKDGAGISEHKGDKGSHNPEFQTGPGARALAEMLPVLAPPASHSTVWELDSKPPGRGGLKVSGTRAGRQKVIGRLLSPRRAPQAASRRSGCHPRAKERRRHRTKGQRTPRSRRAGEPAA